MLAVPQLAESLADFLQLRPQYPQLREHWKIVGPEGPGQEGASLRAAMPILPFGSYMEPAGKSGGDGTAANSECSTDVALSANCTDRFMQVPAARGVVA